MKWIARIVGNRIRDYRCKRKWTQEYLAEQAGFHYTYIGSIERGEKVPTIETVFRICKALDYPMEMLFENIIARESITEFPRKFFDLANSLPEKEQKELYDLLKSIVAYRK